MRSTFRYCRRLPIWLAGATLGAVWITGPAAAQLTLQEALALSYETNPTLLAEIANLRATNELIAQALAGYRPTVEAEGSYGAEWNETVSNEIDIDGVSRRLTDSDFIDPASVGINLSQPIWQGGRTPAQVRQAENLIQSGRAQVISTEQSVLLDAATAYMDVVQNQAVLELQINNEQVLERQLEATQDRFEVGEVTRTDVSQAESRLAGAVADRINAEGTLSSSRAEFERVIGVFPGTLEPPRPLVGLPTSLEETIALAEVNNPAVVGAEFTERASQEGVDVARADLLPQIFLRGAVRHDHDPQDLVERVDTASVTAQITVPLYQAGAVTSRVREARHVANQNRIQIDEARRTSIEGAISAWEGLVTSRAAINSLVAQVRAADIALEGVQQEALVGARTVLDVLDAEQELLDARVGLVQAQRDEVVAGFQVLSAVGQLTARDLGLPVEYLDFDSHYDEVRNLWWGTSID